MMSSCFVFDSLKIVDYDTALIVRLDGKEQTDGTDDVSHAMHMCR